MAEADDQNQEENSEITQEETSSQDSPLTDIVDLEPASLTEEQKTTLEEHKADLTPEQAEKFGIKQDAEEEKIDVDKVEPETRGAKKEDAKKEDDEKYEDEEDEIAPDDEKAISKVVKKVLSPYEKREAEREKEFQALKDEKEVDALIATDSSLTKYRSVALKYMSHPAYANIPASNIMAIVTAKDAQALGAKKEREAAAKARETQNGANGAREHVGKVDWATASKEDFEKKKSEVMGRGGS